MILRTSEGNVNNLVKLNQIINAGLGLSPPEQIRLFILLPGNISLT